MTTPPSSAPSAPAPPKDRSGHPVRVNALVSIWGGGGRGTVASIAADGQVVVTRTDGKEVTVDAGNLTVLRDIAPAESEPEGGSAPPTVDQPTDEQQQPDEEPVQEPEAPEIAGATPAPGVDPSPDALSTLYSADKREMAWLEPAEDAASEPKGYLRTEADNPDTTVTFDSSASWAEEVDRRNLVDPAIDPPAPDQTAEIAASQQDEPVDEDVAPSQTPVQPGRAAGAAAPDVLDAFYRQELVDPSTAPEDVAIDDQQARREIVADLAGRLEHLPEETYLTEEEAAVLAAITSGEIVYLRQPRRGFESQWVHTEIDRAYFDQYRAQGRLTEGVEVVTAKMLRATALRDRVAGYLALWATTSNADNPRALALQEVAADTFGMDAAEDWDIADVQGLPEQVSAIVEDEGTLMGEFLTAVYDATQERLRSSGITAIEVWRGYKVYGDTPDWAAPASDGETVTGEVPLRPLSSFTSNLDLANSFARGRSTEEAYLLDATVPAARIVSTSRTGFGALGEAEVVVMSGPGEWQVSRVGIDNGETSADGFDPEAEGWAGDDVEEWDEEPVDLAQIEPALLLDGDELAAAIAASEDADNARREALVQRATAMDLLDLVPPSWQGDGSIVEPPKGDAIGSMTDQEYDARLVEIEAALAAAVEAGLMTDIVHTLDPDRFVWMGERADAHKAVVDALYGTSENVPDEGHAVLSGGLPGVRTNAVLDATHLNGADYFEVSVDAVLAQMAEQDLIPPVGDLAPLEASPLVYAEAQHISLLLVGRAIVDKRNLHWVLAMSDHEAIESRVSFLRAAGYGVVEGLFGDISIEVAVERTREQHRADEDRWRNGDGYGGRYIPATSLRSNTDTDWSSSNRAAFEEAKDQFSQWAVYDDTLLGSAPTRTSASKGFGSKDDSEERSKS